MPVDPRLALLISRPPSLYPRSSFIKRWKLILATGSMFIPVFSPFQLKACLERVYGWKMSLPWNNLCPCRERKKLLYAYVSTIWIFIYLSGNVSRIDDVKIAAEFRWARCRSPGWQVVCETVDRTVARKKWKNACSGRSRTNRHH